MKPMPHDDQESCCPPTDPPSASYYKRHLRQRTLPCRQALNDGNAYRKNRRTAQTSEESS